MESIRDRVKRILEGDVIGMPQRPANDEPMLGSEKLSVRDAFGPFIDKLLFDANSAWRMHEKPEDLMEITRSVPAEELDELLRKNSFQKLPLINMKIAFSRSIREAVRKYIARKREYGISEDTAKNHIMQAFNTVCPLQMMDSITPFPDIAVMVDPSNNQYLVTKGGMTKYYRYWVRIDGTLSHAVPLAIRTGPIP